MKRTLTTMILLTFLTAGLSAPANAAVKAGTKCTKLGLTAQSGGKKYTCIQLGKYLYWNNGSAVKSAAKPIVSPSPVTTVNPNADEKTPTPVTSVTAKWGSDKQIPTPITSATARWSDDNLIFDIKWDSGNQSNAKAQSFMIEMTIKNEVYKTKKDVFPIIRQNQQTLVLTRSINQSIFGVPQTEFNKVCIYVVDDFINKSPNYCLTDIPRFVLPISPPVISVSPIINGYTVTYVTPNSDFFNAIQIVEYTSSSSSEPTGVNYSATSWNKSNPVNVIVQTTNSRWVKARFSSNLGIWTDYSAAVFVTPILAIQVK